MSDSIFKCDFNKLKFNLYEIMKLTPECTSRQVKKVYRKLVSKFHPDKNNNVEEDIFNHIVIAYQVLSNPIEKTSYDSYLNNINKTSHRDIKQSYDNKQFHSNDSYEISKKKYVEKIKKLEMKHKLKQVDNVDPLVRIKSLKKVREQVQINYENIINNDDFNSKFNQRRTGFENKSESNQLTTVSKDTYTIINNYDDLYINDSVVSDKFSSLDNAFILNSEIKYNVEDISDKMNRYKNESEYLKNLPNSKYLNMQYGEWKK
tara:strand:- start:3479 stop:4261 length:783 start_codon:yes stop_codon:yes gene_type:complete